jgi:hypothetical protein
MSPLTFLVTFSLVSAVASVQQGIKASVHKASVEAHGGLDASEVSAQGVVKQLVQELEWKDDNVAADVCHSTSASVADSWCNTNCNHIPRNCPPSLCRCDDDQHVCPKYLCNICESCLHEELTGLGYQGTVQSATAQNFHLYCQSTSRCNQGYPEACVSLIVHIVANCAQETGEQVNTAEVKLCVEHMLCDSEEADKCTEWKENTCSPTLTQMKVRSGTVSNSSSGQVDQASLSQRLAVNTNGDLEKLSLDTSMTGKCG